jgi:hypothetical protein
MTESKPTNFMQKKWGKERGASTRQARDIFSLPFYVLPIFDIWREAVSTVVHVPSQPVLVCQWFPVLFQDDHGIRQPLPMQRDERSQNGRPGCDNVKRYLELLYQVLLLLQGFLF